jgi:sugar phosphate isomerase/epimerase
MASEARFAVCNEMFEGWEFDAVCRFVAEAGYEALEVAPFTLAPDASTVNAAERRQLRRQAESAGVEIAGLHWLLVSPKGLYINHPDANVRRRTVAYLRALAELCADLGGKVMVFGSPAQRKVYQGLGYQQAWDLALDAVRSVAPTLEQTGVTLCMEPLPQPETDFLNTAAETARFVGEVGHPNVRMIADVKSMCAEGDPAAIIRAYGPMIAHVHANDANRRGPGFGDVDFAPIARALTDVGYRGYVSVEVFDYSPDPQTIARESLAYLRRAFGG